MSKLLITLNKEVISEFPLLNGAISIGRNKSNDIYLADHVVSGSHALIFVSDHVVIEDLDSTNGTYVNGRKIRKTELSPQDIIQMGRYQLQYVTDRPESKDERSKDFKPQETVALREWDVLGAQGAPMGFIKILEGEGAGDTLDLRNPFTAIGKMGENVAVIKRSVKGFTIRKASGDGKTLVNNRQVGDQPLQLKDRDEIAVAGMRLAFFQVAKQH